MSGLGRRVLAEFIGAAFLVTAIIGSGIAASSRSPSDVGLQLFENAAATAAARAFVLAELVGWLVFGLLVVRTIYPAEPTP